MNVMRRLMIACIAVGALVVPGGAFAQTLQLIDNPMLGEFIDITDTGQPLVLPDEGEAQIGTFGGSFVLLPGLIVVGMNGGLGFGNQTVTYLEPVNQPIPSGDAFLGGQALLAYWDDIDDKEGDVLSQGLAGRQIVQWNFGNFDGTGSTLKLQVQFFENAAPTGIYAQLLYKIEGPSTGAGVSATIGYQDGTAGFGDIEFSFNEPDTVTDGTVLSLMIPSPADLTGDGMVNVLDLIEMLSCYGQPAVGGCASADLTDDGVINVLDLIALLLDFGSPAPTG